MDKNESTDEEIREYGKDQDIDEQQGEKEMLQPESGEEVSERKRTPQDAFDELKQSVLGVRSGQDAVMQFLRIMREKLLRQDDEVAFFTRKPLLESLFRIHSELFKKISSIEAGNSKPDLYLINLFEFIESELGANDLQVIRPLPGDLFDNRVMRVLANAPCPFWKKTGTVAQTFKPGYARSAEQGVQILQKADIELYVTKKKLKSFDSAVLDNMQEDSSEISAVNLPNEEEEQDG